MADIPNDEIINEQLSKIYRESEERDAQKRAQKLNLPYVDLRQIPISLDAISILQEEEARKAKAAVVEKKIHNIALVVYNPQLSETQKIINILKDKGFTIKIFIVSQSSLEEAWKLYKFVIPPQEEITGKISIKQSSLEQLTEQFKNLDKLKQFFNEINFNEIQTTEFFQIILAGSLANRVSDIHFEAQEKGVRLRFRIDGVLYDILNNIPFKNYDALLSRIKLLSNMKINIHEEPQDGRFTINLAGKETEIRVSVIPSEFGETIVMRILDPSAINVGLEKLGIREDDLAILSKNIKKPNGLILNTGPTGSGKTTTLYSILKDLNSPEIKIITIEDPIEYRIEGIEQTQVDPSVGYDFASGLRSIVRQDPDIILVGEIRDKETAEIALQAALTGHLVLSTLHTNDSIGAIPRLVDLGVKPQTIGPAISLIIAQRLVRRLCDNCKKEVELTDDLKNKISKFLDKLPPRVKKENYTNFKIYTASGCEVCSGIGYKGRLGIFEFFEGGPDIEELILKEVSWLALNKIAKQKQFVNLQQDGILKVLKGETTFKEVEGVTGPIEWENLI
jgi:type IV pilus assembly protein PilB